LKTEAKKNIDVSSNSLEHRRTEAAKVIETILDEETFVRFTQGCKRLDFSIMGDYMEKYHVYHLSDQIWQYFNTFDSSKTGKMNWDDKKFIMPLLGRII
jgi:hypothetical protein